MKQRPRSILGLSLHLFRTRWSGLDRTRKLAILGAVVALGFAALVWGRCLLGSGSCPTTGGCPYSQAAVQSASPCAR